MFEGEQACSFRFRIELAETVIAAEPQIAAAIFNKSVQVIRHSLLSCEGGKDPLFFLKHIQAASERADPKIPLLVGACICHFATAQAASLAGRIDYSILYHRSRLDVICNKAEWQNPYP